MILIFSAKGFVLVFVMCQYFYMYSFCIYKKIYFNSCAMD